MIAASNDSQNVHSPLIIQTPPILSTGDSSSIEHPHFLHHFDNLGIMLVSQPLTETTMQLDHVLWIWLYVPKPNSALLVALFLALIRRILLLPYGNDETPWPFLCC